jgi:FkbM family methyltransferase
MHHHLTQRRHTVWDIGAEEGDFPALWASWGCDVALVEPNARVWPNIKAIWDANELPDPVACFEGFAADASSETLGVSTGWPESAHGEVIGDHGFLNLCERPDVQRIRIDDMAGIVDPPTAITVDVEGAELHVLAGAEQTLREHRPLVWVSVHPEFMWDMYDHTPEMLDGFMDGCGYESTFLCVDHERHEFYSPVELQLAPR